MYWMSPNSDFSGWKFIGVNLDGLAMPNTRFTGCDFTSASMVAAVLSKALLDGAKMVGADLTRAVLSGADLRGANLTSAILVGTNLARVKFDEYTRFDGAHIVGVILSSGVEITKDGSIRSRQ
ncbi:MAG: pentapeptide repeat-containing protein [Candidatus Wildermuthbacteria bacterium]|nr:pentapeptide repeat-containing protein [Candidatus Wildermuthbacteria bacterium]